MTIWIAIIIGSLGGLLLITLSELWIKSKEEDEISHELAVVFSAVIVKLRREFYLREYGLSQIECDEFHLPGDCLLCGAK